MQQPLVNKPHKGISSLPTPATDPAGPPAIADQFSLADLDLHGLTAVLRSQLRTFGGKEELMSRLSAHLTVVLLAILAVALSTVHWSWESIGAIRPLKQVKAEPVASQITGEEGIPLTLPSTLGSAPDDVFARAAVPRTIIPERARQEITTYNVVSGDSIYGIANKVGLAPETIMWSNPHLEDNPDLLNVGQELVILPLNGVYHQVGGSDTIEGIASTYKTDPQLILDFPLNELDPENPVIVPGQWIVVPGGSKPFVPRTVTAYTGEIPGNATAGSGAFVWPASGNIYQGFWAGHPAVDIAAWPGAPVLAADSGYVIVAGWDNSGYGFHVVIDHGNGYQTLYAHLQAYYVDAGQNVAKGTQIGEMGSTGFSTGPHLHF
jgi:murein DD-endopeptidase MepM/ murein hydrolase activator NlpD